MDICLISKIKILLICYLAVCILKMLSWILINEIFKTETCYLREIFMLVLLWFRFVYLFNYLHILLSNKNIAWMPFLCFLIILKCFLFKNIIWDFSLLFDHFIWSSVWVVKWWFYCINSQKDMCAST